MSFLPHGRPGGLSWYGSFAASFSTHAALVSFVVYSGVVILTPRPPEPDEAPEFTVSLEILDANIIEELEPVDDTNLVPEDAVITEPDAPDAEAPDDLAALSPDDQELLAPEDEALLAPDAEELLEPEVQEPDVLEPEVAEPDVTEPEVTEPEVIEPDPLEPQLAEPELIAPEPVEPELAEPEIIEPEPTLPELTEIQPEPEDTPLLVPEELIEPEPVINDPAPEEQVAAIPDLPDPTPLPLPEPDLALAIDDLSPIDDTVLNPLATGGSGVAPLEEDVLALLAPEPELPEVPTLQPDVVEDIAPIVLPDANVETPAVIEPEPEVAPEIVAEPEPASEPDIITEPDAVEEPNVVEETPEIPEVAPDLPDPDAEPDAETQTATAPTRAPLANPSASEIAIGQLLRRIRATPQEQCTLALPRRVVGDGALAGLSMVGAREDQLDALARRITDGLDFTPVQTLELLDPRQCAALDALRQSESYPANRIGLSLDTATLTNGDLLSGRIVGAGGLYVTLLLVDDNGVVQDLAPFVTLDGNTPLFEAPVARSGPSRATRQVLLAIGTAGAPLDLSENIGQEAQDVFGQIPSEVLENMVFGVTTFDVQ
ncbi:MAG: hypothetical protein ABJF86_06240 [Tateyamaria sp.]|uniref:hypothetical protein n=1 Tax=Tateyamaria sp. TaxID=1929288 RepID=UPI00328F1A1E